MITFDHLSQDTPHWPALESYVAALRRMSGVELHPGGGEPAPDAADAWHVTLQDGGKSWLVSVKRPADAAHAAWREPVLLRMLHAMERNLGGEKALREWPPAVQKTWSLVTTHPCQSMSLAEVAGCVDLSSGYLGEQFEKILGSSFKRILRDERVAYACTQLEGTDRRVSEIARGVGGLSLSQFNRNFVAATGISPSEWREKYARKSAPPAWSQREEEPESSPA